MYSTSVKKLVFKINTLIYNVDSGVSGILETNCKGLQYDADRKMFILGDDIDVDKCSNFLYPLLGNLEECVKYGDTEQFFQRETVKYMKWATEFYKKWDSVEQYHKHIIHCLP